MKQTVTFSDFYDAFRAVGRYDQFGYDALEVLFDYLTEMEKDCGVEMELNVIALCCEYSVDSVTDFLEAYDIEYDATADYDEKLSIVEEYLSYNSTLCGVTPAGEVVYCSTF